MFPYLFRQIRIFSFFAAVFSLLAGSVFAMIRTTYPSWYAHEQAVREQKEYTYTLVGSGFFSFDARNSYMEFLSGHNLLSGQIDPYLQGTYYLLQSYALAFTSDVQGLRTAQELNQKSVDILENALLLADDDVYADIQKNYQTAFKVGACITIKSCLFTLQHASSFLSHAQVLVQQLEDIRTKEYDLLQSYATRTYPTEFLSCIQELLQQNTTLAASVPTYAKSLTAITDTVGDIFAARVQDPSLCLMGDVSSFSGNALSVHIQELLHQHQQLVAALSTGNVSFIMQRCAHEVNDSMQSGIGSGTAVAEQLQDIQQSIDHMQKGTTTHIFEDIQKQKSTDGTQQESLDAHTQKLLQDIQDIGASWRQRVEEQKKDPTYGAWTEVHMMFTEFNGYSGYFTQDMQQKEENSLFY